MAPPKKPTAKSPAPRSPAAKTPAAKSAPAKKPAAKSAPAKRAVSRPGATPAPARQAPLPRSAPAASWTARGGWVSGEVRHEGRRLLLRRPEALDVETVSKGLPRLVVITHVLEELRPDGLPEAEYEETLALLDNALVSYPAEKGLGKAVLVETFQGRRNYYWYTAATPPLEQVRDALLDAHPGHELEFHEKPDADGSVLRAYARAFFR